MIISSNSHVVISDRKDEIFTVDPTTRPRSLHFTGCDGSTLTGARLEGTQPATTGSNSALILIENSPRFVVERCGIIDCNPADLADEYKYLYIKSSPRAQVRFSTFAQKHNLGPAIATHGNADGHGGWVVDHCLFDGIAGAGAAAEQNGTETIRFWDSKNSHRRGDGQITDNLFRGCGSPGEPEVVSIKCGYNVVAGNVLLDCLGGLTSRHGTGNKFIENYIRNCRIGIRIIDADHQVLRNYIEDQTGSGGMAGAIVLLWGLPNSPRNGYFAAHNALVQDNILNNCETGVIVTNGGKDELTIRPTWLQMADNGPGPRIEAPLTPGMVGMLADTVVDPPVDPPVTTDLAARVAALEALTFVLAADSQRHQRRFAALAAALAEK